MPVNPTFKNHSKHKDHDIMATDFVPLLAPKDHVELDLGKGLLEGAGIPFTVGNTDRVEMLKVLEGASAEGLRCLLVPEDRLDDAIGVLEEAWGPDVLAGRDPRC